MLMRLWLWLRGRDVSRSWLQSHARSEWAQGIDQSCIQWPIKRDS